MPVIKATGAGCCAVCGDRFYYGDPIVVTVVKQSLREAVSSAAHSTCCGYTKDGKIAGDYKEAGRDPDLRRIQPGGIFESRKEF